MGESSQTPSRRSSVPWWAWASLVAGMGLSTLAAWMVKLDAQASAHREFEFACSEIGQNIAARLDANEQVLHAGVGLFNTLDSVRRSDWKTFSRSLMVDHFLPGTQGLGYAMLFPPEQLEAHTRAVRAEGFPDYTPRPPGHREVHSAIVYLEPLEGRNLRAFGFDMLSEPVRRRAMEASRDENRPTLSGKVTLVQETGKDVQAGTLLYLPVYRKGASVDDIHQRRKALIGWVYSPYRMSDLMQGTLRGWDLKRKNHPILLEVFDGDTPDTGALLYRSRISTDSLSDTSVFLSRTTSIEFAQRRWTLRFLQLGSPHPWLDYRSAWVVLGGGYLISLLLAILIWTLSNTRSHARSLAEASTRELREMTERLSLATRAGGVGIWEYDLATQRLVWDEQMFLLYGIPRESFVPAYETWRSGVHPDDRAHGEEDIQRAIRGEKEFDTEFRVVWPDGSIHHIRALSVVHRDAGGKPLRMIGTNWDITREKAAQEALRESEKKITQLLQTTDQGIYGIDAKGRCTFVNRSGLELIGYTLEECLGRDMHELVHHARVDGSPYPSEHCPIYRSKLEGVGCRLDTEVFWRKDRTSFPVEYSSHPVVVDGAIEGAVVTFSDITFRKQSESALVASNEELQEATLRANEMAIRAELASAAKSEFLANMSHEIRTPMNGVLGMTGLLLDTQLDREQRRFAEIIRQSAEALLSLINDILDFSKIEAGKLELEDLDFHLPDLVSDLTTSLSPRIRDKRLDFHCQIAPDIPPHLRGDSGRLRQILLNLLSNAIKFTSRGSITLVASLDSQTEHEAVVRLRVKDTGIGIPLDKQASLFQKFTQVDASTTRQFGGTGLGLAISKQLAELMGGEIGMSSQEGMGTEFWFTARLAKSDTPLVESGAKSGPANLRELRTRPVRILLAEDNITNQLVAMGILEKLGLRVDVVANGKEALRALEQLPYDLVLMDVQMPEIDGFDATREIRNRHSRVLDHSIPVVAMTANAMQGDRERCLAAGMNDYVSKPVSPKALAETLDKWLPKDPHMESEHLPTDLESTDRVSSNDIVFDWPGLVERMLGEENLARKILRSSMDQIPGQAALLGAAMESADLPEVRRLAHALKGAISNLGGEQIRHDLELLEQSASGFDTEAVLRAGPSLKTRFERLFEAMRAHL